MIGVHVSSSYDHPILGGRGKQEQRIGPIILQHPLTFAGKHHVLVIKTPFIPFGFVVPRASNVYASSCAPHISYVGEYLAPHIRTTIQGGRVVASPSDRACRSDHKTNRRRCRKQNLGDGISHQIVLWTCTRLS
jgi:hypothetical protein